MNFNQTQRVQFVFQPKTKHNRRVNIVYWQLQVGELIMVLQFFYVTSFVTLAIIQQKNKLSSGHNFHIDLAKKCF